MTNHLPPLTASEIDDLRRLEKAATPGPWRKHDHADMARVGSDPKEWIGYAWVGQIGKYSEPDGRFDGMIADLDRRKDGSETWRTQATNDAAFIAAVRNALPRLIDMVERSQTDCENWRIAYADCDLMRQQYSTELADLRRQLAEREAEVERLKVSAKSSAEENEYLHNKLCEAHLDPSK